ncbi:MAG: ArgE/DapE family deacylase [Actinomycetia bacterium]|nr:ArgE/DapE family deacylase [Actinomycetes bacterium]
MSRADETATAAAAELERAVLADIEANEDALFDLLATLVRFRTPNPPGGNEAEAQSWVESHLRGLGLEVDRWDVLPNRPNVVGVWRGAGGGHSITLNGHIDVCEDRLLEQWSNDPYDPVIDGRDLIGRGSSDMKSANASFMFAVQVLQQHGVQPEADVIVHSVMGEEAGEPGTQSAIKRGYGGDFAIVGESSSGRDLVACIGVMNCRISITSPKSLHLSARKFTMNAGGELQGANCVDKMALRIIPALTDLERQWAVFKTHDLVPPGAGNINVFRIDGGTSTFMLPDRCDAYVTVTYLPHERKDDVIAEVEEQVARAALLDGWLREHPPTIEWNPPEFPVEFMPSDIDLSSEAIATLRESVRDASGLEPRIGGRGGITDAGWFAQAGIPAVVFGPGDVSYAHRIDERVHLDEVVNHCKATALFLLRYGGRRAQAA